MTTEFWIGLIIALGTNIATVAAAFGGFSARLKMLEKKVDIHNNLVDRMYKVEAQGNEFDFRLKCLENKEE